MRLLRNLKTSLIGTVAAGLVILATATSAPINVARVLDQGSAASQMFSSGDLTGTLTTLSASSFDAMTVSQLTSSFDAIVIGCCDSTNINADWASRLLPYLNAGGGIVWENPYSTNLSKLAPAITANGPTGPNGPWTITTTVAGITDGITNEFINNHIGITAFSSEFSVFLTGGSGSVQGLYGEFSCGGRMVLTGPDSFLHSSRGAAGASGNQYNLALNSLNWVTSGSASVPEPASFAVLGLGLAGLCLTRRKRAA